MWRLFLFLIFLWPVPAGAEEDHLGAHFRDRGALGEVLDARCTVCHTRDRVDAAFRERRDIQEIQRQMVERGAVLDERDKQVLGTFWGTPLKSREK